MYLKENELIFLPKEIGQLTQLTDLTLNGNKLIKLPKEIVNLKKITMLDIDSLDLSKGQLEWIIVLKNNDCEVNGRLSTNLCITKATLNEKPISSKEAR